MPNIFFRSSHIKGIACLSCSMPISFSKIPAMIAWIISGESKVKRMIRETQPSSLPMALASSWTLENLPLSINVCQRNALARLVMNGVLYTIISYTLTDGIGGALKDSTLTSDLYAGFSDNRSYTGNTCREFTLF